MKNKSKVSIAQYLVLAVFAVLFALIVKPYLGPIIFAIFFAIVFHPLFNFFQKNLKFGKNLSALTTVLLTFIFILTPLFIFLGLVVSETAHFVNSFDTSLAIQALEHYRKFEIFGFEIDLTKLQNEIQNFLKSFGIVLFEVAKAAASNIFSFAISFIIFLLLYFYTLRDGDKFLVRARQAIPFNKKQKNSIIQDFKATAKTVFIGNLFGAALSGLVAYIGFRIFQIPAPTIWALLTGILSLLPSIGSLIVYIITTLIAFFISFYFGVGMISYFVVAEVVLVQNILRPKLLDDKIKVHPVLVFFALVGGVQAFGSPGILYGPLIVVIFVSIYEFMIDTIQQTT